MNTSSPTRRILLGIGISLAIILILGTILARRLLIFAPDNLIFTNDATYQLSESRTENTAIFGRAVELKDSSLIDGHTMILADSVDAAGTIIQDLNILAERVHFSGQVEGNAVFFAEAVEMNGGAVTGETVVFCAVACVEYTTKRTNHRLC